MSLLKIAVEKLLPSQRSSGKNAADNRFKGEQFNFNQHRGDQFNFN